jgi:hypothetical protein
MSTEEQRLALELRFHADGSAHHCANLFNSLVAFDPRMKPTHVEKTEHFHLDEPELWTPEMAGELAAKCAGTDRFSWTVLNPGSRCAMTFERRRGELAISEAMPQPTVALPLLMRDLSEALQGEPSLRLAMLFDLFSTEDAEVMSEGLHGLKHVPPILYLDGRAVERAGGRARLLRTPCEVEEIRDGLLLIVRSTLWDPETPEQAQQRQAVAEFLGVSQASPLVFE